MPSRQPNVIIIQSDDQGYGDFSCIALRTCKHPISTGCTMRASASPIPMSHRCVRPTQNGYATGLFGKWHLGDADSGRKVSGMEHAPARRILEEYVEHCVGHCFFRTHDGTAYEGYITVDEAEDVIHFTCAFSPLSWNAAE